MRKLILILLFIPVLVNCQINHVWRLDSDVTDAIGGANGTSTNVTHVSGIINGSAKYTESPASKTTFEATTNNWTTQAFTYSFFINAQAFHNSSGDPFNYVINKSSYNVSGYFCIIASTFFNFFTCQGGANQSTSASFSFNTDMWYYIVITRSGSSVRIYVNGDDKVTSAGTHTNPANSSSSLLYFSKVLDVNPSAQKLDNVISEERAWSATEIKNKYAYYKGFYQ
jgi:hypothetical protein